LASRAKACPAGFERDEGDGCSAPAEPGTLSSVVTAAPFTTPPTTLPTVTISLAEYNTIQLGWTLQQVIDTIGGPGQLQSSSEGGGYKFESYQWIGSGFCPLGAAGNASVQFQNDRVTGKTQYGLQ
jgi:hypothetical protein